MTAIIDKEKCTACGECLASCPLDAIALNEQQDGKAEIDSDTCGECGVCIDICPAMAISL